MLRPATGPSAYFFFALSQQYGQSPLLKWVQLGCLNSTGSCFNTEIYGELRDAQRGMWLGESGPWREHETRCAVLGQRLLCLPVLGGCHRAGSMSQTCSLTHPYHSLHACLKPVSECNSTTLFTPQAANSSSISQPRPKGLR